MPIENSKSREIKRLTTPLTFKNSKAYDCEGNVINCVETLSDVRFIIEPKKELFSDDEIMQFAPESKAASEIRLKRGFGDSSDVLLIHQSLPWILGLYFIIILCITVPISFSKNLIGIAVMLILIIVPLVYLYGVFNLNSYDDTDKVKKVQRAKPKKQETVVEEPEVIEQGVDSLKGYGKEIDNLKVLFNVKEEVVKDLIEKRFEPPQITYDKFMTMINKCNTLFYSQVDSAVNIINLAAEDTPRVREEIEVKIGNMKTIINQIEELTDELVININSDDHTKEEVNNLLEDMGNLIDSVKEY